MLSGNKFVLLREISNVWIGLNKLKRCWKFSDGSRFDFHPSDKKFSDPKTEKCARIIPEGLWDMTCDKEYSYICSYSKSILMNFWHSFSHL